MPATLVLQSHRSPLPHSWLRPCLDSVENWAKRNGFAYQFLGDEFFEILSPWVIQKTSLQRVIATDLARLKWMQTYLSEYERVIWMDADFLIFAPDKFTLLAGENLPEQYALGREVWVQPECADSFPHGKLKVYKKVHNAFLLFERGNHFLDFYTAHAERLLQKNRGSISPQFIGPKLLTALHNVIQCPVQEDAGMLSPWLVQDLLMGGGPALNLFLEKSPQKPSAVNLCSSLVGDKQLADNDLERVIKILLADKEIGFTNQGAL